MRIKNALYEKVKQENDLFLELRKQYYKNFWQKASNKFDAKMEEIEDDFFIIRKNGFHTFVHFYEVELDNHLILDIAGKKNVTNKLLAKNRFPVPNYLKFNLNNISDAVEFLNRFKSIVIKPTEGGGGKGVTVGIRTEEQLRKAIISASIYSKDFLVEEEIEGQSFRLLYLNGDFIDAIRRDPPIIKGDGKNDIKSLIRKTNKARINNTLVEALSPINIDQSMINYLKQNKLNLKAVLKKGEITLLKKVVNQNSASENHVVKDDVHHSTIEIGKQIVKYFGIELAGLDIITTNISEPLEVNGGVINEINTTPGLHHHDLVSDNDKKIDIGYILLKYIFENKKYAISNFGNQIKF